MKDHSRMKRGFSRYTEAWYAKVNPLTNGVSEEIMFGLYAPEGGSTGEMGMRWKELGGKPTPRLECFSDAFDALTTFSDVLARLAEFDRPGPEMTPDDFCAILRDCGFEDRTARERE